MPPRGTTMRVELIDAKKTKVRWVVVVPDIFNEARHRPGKESDTNLKLDVLSRIVDDEGKFVRVSARDVI